MPGQFEGILDKLQTKLGKQTIRRASTINRPRPKLNVIQIKAINDFVKRNPRADGGSVNGSYEAALRKKIEELMDDGYEFGEAVREAMRQGYKKGGEVRKIYKIARPITTIDRKQNPNIPDNAKFKMQVPGGKFRGKGSSTEMIYDTSKTNLNQRLKEIESDVYVKPSKPKKPIPDDKFLVKKSSKRIKENINEIEYEEVLGKKNQPDTFKPTGKTVTKYKPFIGPDKITIPGQGANTLKEAEKFVKKYFKENPKQIRVRDPKKDYESKDVREKALKETDPTKAKGTKKFNYHHVRQIAGGVPLTTDDVMIINQRINSALGTKYNKPLNSISAAIQKNNRLALEAMNAKQEGLALDYMKRVDNLNDQAEKIVNSAIDDLPKKYKGYVGFNQFELPRDEYGLPISNEPMKIKKIGGMPVSKNAVDLTMLDLKQEKKFKQIVSAQAKAGKVGPINKMSIDKILYPTTLADTYYNEMLENYEKNFNSLSPRDKMPMYQNATKKRMQSMAKLYAKYGKDVVDNAMQKNSINLDDLTKPGSTSDRRRSLERKIKRGPPSLKSDAFGIGTAIEEGPRALKKAGQLGVRGASKVLGYGAIPLELYFMNEARKQGKSTAEILAMPLLMEGRVGELQDMMKLTPVERQGYNRAKINEDESLLDTDFYTPDKEGIELIDNEATKDYIKKSRKLEEALRRDDRSKPKQRFTLPNLTGILEDEV